MPSDKFICTSDDLTYRHPVKTYCDPKLEDEGMATFDDGIRPWERLTEVRQCFIEIMARDFVAMYDPVWKDNRGLLAVVVLTGKLYK